MTRTKRLIAALGIAGLIAAGTALTASGVGDFLPREWALSCVELNDLIERHHLHREGNVGIYQRAHGDNAELACQTDHREDVRALFHWAFRPTEELSPVDPRYKHVSPTALGNIDSARFVGKIEHTSNRFGDFTLGKGRYIAVINWWDKDERTAHEHFTPSIFAYQLGLVGWSINLANSDADAGSAHVQFWVHARAPFIAVNFNYDGVKRSYTKWTVKFYQLL